MNIEEDWNKQVFHPLQTWEWGEFKKSTGVEVTRENGFLITWHKIPFTPFCIGYMPKSRLPDLTDIKHISKLAKSKNALLVRMEPDALKARAKSWLRTYGEILKPGRRFFTPETFWMHLDKTEEELLATMHPKARYNVRLAQKKGVTVQEDNSEKAFDRYLDLTFGETSQRQRFYAHDRDYHHKMWKHLHATGLAHLFTATFEGKILVTWIIFKFNEKIYYPYGASSHDHKEVQAPSLMLWQTALWGKSQDCQIFDLWGAEEGKGFNEFKVRFGAELVEFVGTWDLVVNPILYPLFRLSEELRWKILHAIK